MSRLCRGLILFVCLAQPAVAQAPDPADDPLPSGAVTRLGAPQRNFVGLYSLAFAPDGRTVAAGGWDKYVRVWDVISGEQLHQVGPFRMQVHALAYSPDGKHLAAGSWDDTLSVVELDSGKQVLNLNNCVGAGAGLKALAFTPDGLAVVVAGSQRLRLRELATGKEVRAFLGHVSAIQGVALSPDGRVLASVSHDKTLRLWDLATGKELQLILDPTHLPNAVAFSPDGKLLATAGTDKSVRLWETASGAQVWHAVGHQEVVRAVAFTPDGRTVISGSTDRTLRLWETASGKERRRLNGSRGPVAAVAVSPDGKLLASVGHGDARVVLWDLAGLGKEVPLKAELAPGDVETLWAELADDDASRAYRAILALAAAARQAVPMLHERLQPSAPLDPALVNRLLADLDSLRYPVREQASQELEKLGERVVPYLRKALEGRPTWEVRRRVEQLLERLALEGRSGRHLRGLRGLEVLERVGTAEARKVLEDLVRRNPDSDLGQEAQQALQRLSRRPLATP